jgi:phosphatidate cytidylyltransferase
MTRVLTAIPLILLIIVVLEFLPPLYFTLLVAAVVWLTLEEFFSIAGKSGIEIFRWPGRLAALGIIGIIHFYPQDVRLLVVIMVLLPLTILVLGLFRGDSLPSVLAGAATTSFALLYIAVALGLLIFVRTHSFQIGTGNHWILFGLLTVSFGDTGAFCAGQSLGRHLLAPRISPKKTIEGSIGGLLGCALAAWLSHLLWLPTAPLAALLVLSGVIGLAGQVGDLAESALKRGAGVKDSSNLLPGHGGMLDRVDGVLFAAPVLYIYTQWFI